MKIKELQKKSETELNKILGDSREKVRDLRFKVSSDQVKNVREIRNLRKTIARILTILQVKKQDINKESK